MPSRANSVRPRNSGQQARVPRVVHVDSDSEEDVPLRVVKARKTSAYEHLPFDSAYSSPSACVNPFHDYSSPEPKTTYDEADDHTPLRVPAKRNKTSHTNTKPTKLEPVVEDSKNAIASHQSSVSALYERIYRQDEEIAGMKAEMEKLQREASEWQAEKEELVGALNDHRGRAERAEEAERLGNEKIASIGECYEALRRAVQAEADRKNQALDRMGQALSA